MTTNRSNILQANQAGLRHSQLSDNPYWSYYTPTLQAAYDLGQSGVDLSGQPDVSGWRYGTVPDTGRSHNYAADSGERGVSLAALDGQQETGSCVWFCDRRKVSVSGILLPMRGSDGEPLVLVYGQEVWD